ncbi:hypothetical protein ACEQ8H_000241 [Pleosporales sp. CAS-2024a]
MSSLPPNPSPPCLEPASGAAAPGKLPKEPLAALGGVYHLLFTPEQYFAFMPATARYAPESRILCNQLAASYLLFAAIEVLVLRATTDVRVWRAVVRALLLCDVGHLYASWAEMGTAGLLHVRAWSGYDAFTMMTFVVPFVLRVAFLLGVGIGDDVAP